MMDQHAEDHLHESNELESTAVRTEGLPCKEPGSGLSCFTLDTKRHISFFKLHENTYDAILTFDIELCQKESYSIYFDYPKSTLNVLLHETRRKLDLIC